MLVKRGNKINLTESTTRKAEAKIAATFAGIRFPKESTIPSLFCNMDDSGRGRIAWESHPMRGSGA